MRTVHMTTLPTCNADGCTSKATFDTQTVFGPWAHLCAEHMDTIGRRNSVTTFLTDEPEPTRTRSERRADLMAAIEAGDFDAAEDIIGDGDIAEWL